MANCVNCGSDVGCACSLKTTSDGKKVCGMCWGPYEERLKGQNNQNQQINFGALNTYSTDPDAPKITQIVFNNFNK